jgi:hypothetical protein
MTARSGSPRLPRDELAIRDRLGKSAMSALSFGTASRERFGVAAEPKPDAFSVDMAWLVLEAANDLGDHDTVEACRRVIDANLNGRPAPPSDGHLIVDYFR